MNNGYLSTDEIAEKYKVQPRAIRRWINTGKLPAIKLGRQWRIKEADLAKFTEPKGD